MSVVAKLKILTPRKAVTVSPNVRLPIELHTAIVATAHATKRKSRRRWWSLEAIDALIKKTCDPKVYADWGDVGSRWLTDLLTELEVARRQVRGRYSGQRDGIIRAVGMTVFAPT
jgi:hypothetical protein